MTKQRQEPEKTIIVIHGYTGYCDDFNGLAGFLSQNFDADIKVIKLKGHGTSIEDLDTLDYDDFLFQVEKELRKELQKGREVVLGGYSFGAFLALELAASYPVKGVFVVSAPYKLKFAMDFPGLGVVGQFKKYWKKPTNTPEAIHRKNSPYYKYMHINGHTLIMTGRRRIDTLLARITVPVLLIHSRNDPISSIKGAYSLERKLGSPIKKSVLVAGVGHNLFFSRYKDKVYQEVKDFLMKEAVFGDVKEKPLRASAIIPSFNEGKRIGQVLEVLTQSQALSEIIVIDDGSDDNTEDVVKAYKGVTYFRNQTNQGKGYSMERGAALAREEIIFFCDADLRGLTPDIVEQIIAPVAEGSFDMYIGVRSNLMQRAVTLFALNSGERALKKSVWQDLPRYYKYRYRIEAGLNYFTTKHGKGFGWKTFDHYQTLKETKYGIIKGTLRRWWMNFDVACAYAACITDEMRRKLLSSAWSRPERHPQVKLKHQ